MAFRSLRASLFWYEWNDRLAGANRISCSELTYEDNKPRQATTLRYVFAHKYVDFIDSFITVNPLGFGANPERFASACRRIGGATLTGEDLSS